MPLRSWLFVPGDSDKKLSKVGDSGADAIIVDLEDSVVPAAKEAARGKTHDWLEAQRGADGRRCGCGSTRSTAGCGGRTLLR